MYAVTRARHKKKSICIHMCPVNVIYGRDSVMEGSMGIWHNELVFRYQLYCLKIPSFPSFPLICSYCMNQ